MQWIAGEKVEQFDLSGFMGLVKATQANKTAWMDKTSEDRVAICLEALEQFEADFDKICLEEAEFLKVPVQHVKTKAKQTTKLIKEHLNSFDQSSYYPRGVMLCMLPKTYGLSGFLYMSVLGAAYGNSMILKYKNSKAVVETLAKTQLGQQVSVFSEADQDTFEMLCSHPFLDSLVYMGKKQNYESFKALDKHQFASFDAVNTHVVLKNADLNKAVDGIYNAFTYFNGLSPIKPHRVLIAMAVFEEFKELFKKRLDHLEIHLPEFYQAGFEQNLSEIKKDTHSLFYQAQGVYITADLTYCSTFQETEVLGGFLSLSEFKYNHEAAKWINVGSRNRSVTVWTEDAEKAQKFMSKIHAPKVLVNKYESESTYLPMVASGDGGVGVEGHELPPEKLFAQKRIIETA